MEKVQAWFKAHWKPFAVAVAAGIVVWFLFMRKTSSGKTALSIPMVSGGGSAAGAGGPAGSSPNAPAAPPGLAPALPVGSLWDQWLGTVKSAVPTTGRSFKQWTSDLVATYQSQTGQIPAGVTQGAGFYTYSPDFLSGLYPIYQANSPAATTTPMPFPSPVPRPLGAARGSGFRGGDPYPSTFGDFRPSGARAATSGNLPAAPLGTAVAPKQPTAMDVRKAPRRQTAIAQIARGNPPPTMPQSFSVPIREHLEGTRPVVAFQAVNANNQNAATPPLPHTPVPTQAELASSDQKALKPAPMPQAAPNIARGRARFGHQRVPAKPTQRWK